MSKKKKTAARKVKPNKKRRTRQSTSAVKLESNPKVLEAVRFAESYYKQGDLAAAQSQLAKALKMAPRNFNANQLMGVIAHELGNTDLAHTHIQRALKANPNFSYGWFQLGILEDLRGMKNAATTAYRKCLALDPDHLQCANNLAVLLQHQGELSEAKQILETSLANHPEFPFTHANLGNVLTLQGRFDEAIDRFRKAVAQSRDMVIAHSNLLFCLNYSESYSPAEIFAEHKKYGELVSKKISSSPLRKPANSTHKVRLGFLSPDFRRHSVSFFFEPLLQEIDRRKFETWCYYNGSQIDDITQRLRQTAEHWRQVENLDDAQLAQLVRDDQIDILIDLAGHTSDSRLPVFAYRPAPVQVTWLGYPNTTGLREIDYRISDQYADPEGVADQFCTERLTRMKHSFLCYQGDTSIAPCPAPPMIRNRHVTFGSFNHYLKISDRSIRLWSQIMHEVPNAKLLLKAKQFSSEWFRRQLLDKFEEQGIAGSRLELTPATTDFKDHMRYYDFLDIALDTFPYNGTTTTFEALWMGVPTISLCGDRHVSRVGMSILSHLGMPDLVVKSEEDYVSKAVDLASDAGKLERLRNSLRNRLATSVLCDTQAFARDMEDILFEML